MLVESAKNSESDRFCGDEMDRCEVGIRIVLSRRFVSRLKFPLGSDEKKVGAFGPPPRRGVASRFKTLSAKTRNLITIMSAVQKLRRTISFFLFWGMCLVLYLGGAAILSMGLIFSTRIWWALIHQPASPDLIITKSTMLVVLALGFVLVVINPIVHLQEMSSPGYWQRGGRAGSKNQRATW